MSSTGGAPFAGDEVPAAEVREAVSAHWAASVMGTSFVPLSTAEARALTRGFVDELGRLVRAAPFDPEPARAIGVRMVGAHLTSPLALSRTVTALLAAPDSLTTGSRDHGDHGDRWSRLVAAICEGFAAALRDKVLRDQQEIIEAAFVARDHAESARWDAERLLEETREAFIATVSHELRTPLTPIKGYLRLLLSRGDEIGDQQRVEFYRVMLSQADLLEHLADDLRSATDASEAQFRVSPESVDVPAVVKEALESVDPASRREFRWVGDDATGSARCDPLRVRQVLGVLLRNADLYATPDEPVDVSARRVTVGPRVTQPGAAPDDGEQAGDWVEIVVRDYGPGISAELAEAVFEPFRRLGQGAAPGSGLGLHIARRLAEAMHGTIWHTDAHPGSAFHLRLPAA